MTTVQTGIQALSKISAQTVTQAPAQALSQMCSQSSPLLTAANLRREYTRGRERFAAVDNVSLSIAKGEFVCIMGRSGSGKTTLISMLAGLISPTDGSIALNGVDMAGLDDEALSRLRNAVIGYIPQGNSLLPNLTALDNCRLPFYLGDRPGDCAEKAMALLEAMGIAHLADAYSAGMSGGELRRVAIARALINSPALLIADEPTSDLDVETAAEIMRLLLDVNKQGAALLIVTHDPELAKFAARTLPMAKGKLG